MARYQINYDAGYDRAILWDVHTNRAFGEVFHGRRELSARQEAQSFLDWCQANGRDPSEQLSLTTWRTQPESLPEDERHQIVPRKGYAA